MTDKDVQFMLMEMLTKTEQQFVRYTLLTALRNNHPFQSQDKSTIIQNIYYEYKPLLISHMYSVPQNHHLIFDRSHHCIF